MVVMDDAAQYIPTTDPAFSFRYGFGNRGLLIDTLMAASTIVVLTVLPQYSMQM